MDNPIFTYSAIILYLACSALLFIHLKRPASETTNKAGPLSKKQIIMMGVAALCLHGLALYNNMNSPMGIDLGFYHAMSLVSAVIILFTLIAVWRHPVDILAVVLLPLAAITMLIDSISSTHHLLEANSSKALIFHILSSIIAYSLLALAALQAMLLSIQNKFLHDHQPGGLIRLMPPLRNMEVLLFEVIVVGFIALTISLGSGLIFLENMFEQQLAHKTVLSIIAWFVFLILLIGHWKLGWRGRTAIRWTLSGFISLMLAYFGSKFVLEIILV
jgi:ABC-type uncharacterized transport system permease subunit